MEHTGEKIQNRAVIKFIGKPNDETKEKEPTRWKQFLNFIFPWAKKGGDMVSKAKELTENFYEAEVLKKNNEAEKFAAETVGLVAEADLKRQQIVKLVNDEIERIFKNDDLPPLAKQIQLANLLANNPEITEQLQKLEDIIKKLKFVNFTQIELKIEDKTDTN